MIFHENRLQAAILTKYHNLFFQKIRKMSQNLSSAAVVIGALRVKIHLNDVSLAGGWLLAWMHLHTK